MDMKQVVTYFGSQAAAARALGIRQASVSEWTRRVPPLRQLQIERITQGRLRADPTILQVAPKK